MMYELITHPDDPECDPEYAPSVTANGLKKRGLIRLAGQTDSRKTPVKTWVPSDPTATEDV